MKFIPFLLLFCPFFAFADFHLGVNYSLLSNSITREEVLKLIQDLELEFQSDAEALGGRLVFDYQEQNQTISAYATRSENLWKITINAGMARHEAIDLDGLAGILCHEVGHHLGGAPKKLRSMSSQWASVEGQSDYFVTTKCLRRLWKMNDDKISVDKIPAGLEKACSSISHLEKVLCLRMGSASWQIARLAAKLIPRSTTPQYTRPTRSTVTSTMETHPSPQCRLDTYMQGLLCEADADVNFSDESAVTGSCHADLGFKAGLRPKCWFAE